MTVIPFFRAALVAAAFAGVHAAAFSQEHGTRDEAKQMAESAAAHIKKAGPETAYKDFNDKGNAEWHKKDLYVFVYSMEGVGLAHGVNEKLIGKDLSELKDQNDKAFVKQFNETAKKGSGWVDYEWPNPLTKKIESKISYIRKVDGLQAYVGVGAYGK